MKEEVPIMRSMRVHKYSVSLENPLILDEIPEPIPEPNEILVKINAIGVNPIELSIRKGFPNYVSSLTLPHLLGTEFAGEVVQCGNEIEKFKEGDIVFGSTSKRDTYAEFVSVDEKTTSKIPKQFNFSDAAAFPVAFQTAWHALVLRAKATPGEVILVQGGAGGVGTACIQLAKSMGCKVISTVSSKEKGEYCLKNGADHIINYKENNFVAICKEITNGHGVDVIIELAACDNFDKDLDAISIRGRIVLVGMGTGKGPETNFRVSTLMGKNADVLGITANNLGPQIPEINEKLDILLPDTNFTIPVFKEIPLENANECHELLERGKFTGKLILIP